MKKIIAFSLAIYLFLGNQLLYATITPVEEKPYWKVQDYFVHQIKGIGLVDSYLEDDDDKCYVYDSALSAMALMAIGNYGLAREILDTLSVEVMNTPQGVPAEYYFYNNLYGGGQGLAYSGNTAWLLQAFNIYQKLTGKLTYYQAQKRLANFLVKMQDPLDGGLKGSAYDSWKSTEHNQAAYAALRNYGRLNQNGYFVMKAEKIRAFLLSPAVWNGTRFNRGPGDTTEVTDVQAFGALLFGKDYASALQWADVTLKNSKPYNQDTVVGFDFNNDLDTVWIEGTFQMAFALYWVNFPNEGEFYYQQACKVIQPDGSLLLATNRGTAADYWMLEPWRSAAPTSWYIFYLLKFNPLVLY